MKTLVLSSLAAFTVILMSAALYHSTPATPIFEWNTTEYDFGKIEKGVPANHIFEFTNKGDAPLIIHSVKASCGCTVADYSREPIGVYEKGFVKATYNAAKAGVFSKTVTVMANTENEGAIVLTLKGEVVE